MKMVVHIERLVLDGVALTPAEQQRLGPAIEAALGEQLAGLRANPPVRSSRGEADRIGVQVASSVIARLHEGGVARSAPTSERPDAGSVPSGPPP